jgi:hypothetical protein
MLTTQHCKRLETAAPCQSTVQEQEEEEEGLRREMRAERALLGAAVRRCWMGAARRLKEGRKWVVVLVDY